MGVASSGALTSRKTLQSPWSTNLIRKVRKVKKEERGQVFGQIRRHLITESIVKGSGSSYNNSASMVMEATIVE